MADREPRRRRRASAIVAAVRRPRRSARAGAACWWRERPPPARADAGARARAPRGLRSRPGSRSPARSPRSRAPRAPTGRSRARPRWTRSPGDPRTRTRARTDHGRRRSRTGPAPGPRRGGRSGPDRPLGREGACLGPEDRPPPGLVLAVPGDGALQPVLETRPRPPAEQALGPVGRADVPAHLAGTLLDVLAQRRRPAEDLQNPLRNLGDCDVDPGRDVDRLACDYVDRRLDARLD